MQTSLIALGFIVVIAVIAALISFLGFEHNPVIVCMLAWTVLWLGVSQAQRLRVTVGNEAQPAPTQSTTRFWLIRSAALVLSLLLGLTAYTQYLVREYELPKVYQWQAMAWGIGINRPLPVLVEIPAGRFEMGGDESELEQPIHTVTISQPFYMAETETTFSQYDYFVWQMKQAGFRHPEKDPQYPEDENWGRNEHPVINVDWDKSQAYINWLNPYFKEDMSCRLPSEAEWEYAARAGSTTKFYWGDEESREHANYSSTGGRDKWGNETAPVKQFEPNKFGLYDMSGNVYEWTLDKWHGDYTGAPVDSSAWEAGSSTSRVLRGGSWNYTSSLVRSAYRGFDDFGNLNLGFRIVCSPIER